MRYLRTVLFLIAADVLSLFIGLTLAGSANPLIRVISAICGSGVMICLMASFAIKTASDDRKCERTTGVNTQILKPAGMTITALIPTLTSWLVLFLTADGHIDYYRWHKLINGWFIQIYNMIESSASSRDLDLIQIWYMFPLSLVPASIFALFYILAYKGIITKEK